MKIIKKPELLAPAGNLEKLKTAVHFGADAVYMGGKDFSLRNFADNFSNEELKEGIDFARKNNVKTYITCNIYPKPNETEEIKKYLSYLNKLKPDALIIADPGIIKLAKENAPDIEIHLSTQANTTNHETANFWKSLGITRVNLARELTFDDIKNIRTNTDIELETFVHGAMCISYSGRCLLSSFMTKRSANHGECAHPCRWKYRLTEELRPNEYYPFMEDERGTYILNSKDLCMLEHTDKLIEAGIDSLKIEGRMKGIFYLGSVVKVYREAIDYFFENDSFKIDPTWTDLLASVANREYCTGFYMNDPDSYAANIENKKPNNVHNFLGKITEVSGNRLKIGVRNKFVPKETIKVLSPGKKPESFVLDQIMDTDLNPREAAQPNSEVFIFINNRDFKTGDMIYKASNLN